MGEAGQTARASENAEHAIRRSPDLQVVTPGARVRYVCDWTWRGPEPTVAGGSDWGPRDGVRWFSYSDQPPHGLFQRQVQVGPLGPAWDRTWNEEPGHYTVVAEIRSRLVSPAAAPSYCYRPQQIGDTGALLADWLDRLVKTGQGPSPDDIERQVKRYRALIEEVAKKRQPHDAAGAQAHRQTVDKWRELAVQLRGLLSATDGKKRIPLWAMHLERTTQARRPLLLFLTELDDVQRPLEVGTITQKRWVLVDWTDPGDPRFRGTYEGEGDDARQAIESAFRSWDWDNRYPAGSLTFEIPFEVRGLMGGAARRRLDTNGKNLTEDLTAILEWIAIGTMLVAGFCFILVSIPPLASAAAVTAMLASTAGAVFSVSQRWRDGIFDWRADAIDGLTVVGNLIGAGGWARGAYVRILGEGGTRLDYVFLGARVGTDAAQGVLVIASRIDDLTRLLEDPSYPPEERARRLLLLLGQLATAGLMAALSFSAAAKEGENLGKRPRHLGDHPRANVPDERLDALTRPGETIDATAPPIAEGHAREGTHKTTVGTGIARAPTTGRMPPSKSDFALAYPENAHPWQVRKMSARELDLIDKDNFRFHAVCHQGTLNVTIVTVFDPALTPELSYAFPRVTTRKESAVLMARELFPRMYAHFAQVGNPVKRLRGTWAWTNYRDAKTKYDELIARGMTKAQAAKIAITEARTYVKYHKPRGFTKVVSASHEPSLKMFSFEIEKE